MSESTEPMARRFAPCGLLRARTAGLRSGIFGVGTPDPPFPKRRGEAVECLLAM